ncbi:uncharacterized protein LOC123222804 isoform X2 [Mangifera indica]|uniref:uncharacterized protein LOC123222804 isoform X2 n=1 Tax=Mangifera indica TaxID=29780 RepID=UPI001CF9344A|nr:uncharacterized protein LOC123222804 isoform X2 [Mangifera indica]
MVRICPRFALRRTGHRRTQIALDEREVLPPTLDVAGAATVTTAAAHGIEVAVEFKPVEHPIAPMDNGQPLQCPLPEPSILNDGRIWKERVSAGMRRRADLPVMKEGGVLDSAGVRMKPRPMQSNRTILPSLSAPEHDLLNLLQESGI